MSTAVLDPSRHFILERVALVVRARMVESCNEIPVGSATAGPRCQIVKEEKSALEKLLARAPKSPVKRVAFHSPCSLQHGLKIRGVVESLLTAAGYQLNDVPDSHLCCGSADTYSLLQPALSR